VIKYGTRRERFQGKIDKLRARMAREKARAGGAEEKAAPKIEPPTREQELAIICWDIYALSDPRTQRVRYIGATVNVKGRIRSHLFRNEEATRSAGWLRSLKAEGLLPEISIVQSGTGASAPAAERHWISHYRNLYSDLLNVSSGGYSLTERKPNPQHKVKAAAASGQHDDFSYPVTIMDLVRSLAEIVERGASRPPESSPEGGVRKIENFRSKIPENEISKLNQALRNHRPGFVGVLFSPSTGLLRGVSDAR
jgi:GIY-YIG catalytic domain